MDSVGRRVTSDLNDVLATRLATRLWIVMAGVYFVSRFEWLYKALKAASMLCKWTLMFESVDTSAAQAVFTAPQHPHTPANSYHPLDGLLVCCVISDCDVTSMVLLVTLNDALMTIMVLELSALRTCWCTYTLKFCVTLRVVL